MATMIQKVSYSFVLLGFLLAWPCVEGGFSYSAKKAVNASTARSALFEIDRSPNVTPLSYDLLFFLGDAARPCLNPQDEIFRRIDGTCNNLNDPLRGAVLDTQKRLFPNTFLDGRQFPRTRDADFNRLPSAREVSRRCFGHEEDGDGPGNRETTQLLGQFGQLVAHDISLVDRLQGIDRCCDGYKPNTIHPDLLREDGVCFPIDTSNDNVFTTDCMPYARSFGVDFFGAREFVNAVTSFIDLSTIYGSSLNQSDALRSHSRGLLRTRGGTNLPVGGLDHFNCKHEVLRTISDCPVSGDIRVNDHPGMGAIHTLFVLEHNRIANLLSKEDRFWNDERVFQVTRKILIAMMQKITYEDFLPVLLGPDVMEIFHINAPYNYHDTVDANARLEFTTAAFRFGHSLINTRLNNEQLYRQFFVPIEDEEDVPAILFSQARNAPLMFDKRFTRGIRELFYANVSIPNVAPAGVTFDLPALDIQRGRDHGIATYTTVRHACRWRLGGLPGAEFAPPPCLAEGVYWNEDDVDLFVGGVSEKPLHDAIVGPTFACVIAEQFEYLKFGDRFFYEASGKHGFTDEQREQIRGTTLAMLICQLDPNKSLQRDVFRPASDSNPIVPCRTLLRERDQIQRFEMFTELW